MALTCTVCQHPEREVVDAAILGGTPLRDVAGQTGLSRSALGRHKLACLAREVADLATASPAVVEHARAEAVRQQNLGELWEGIRAELAAVVQQAKADGDRRSLLRALDQLSGHIGVALRASELRHRASASALHEHPDFAALAAGVMDALAEHPAAQRAVADALAAGAEP